MKPASVKCTLLLAAISTIALAGCSTFKRSSSSNPSRAKFLDEVWVSPDVRGRAPSEVFTSVYFAPTTTARLSEQGWWRAQNARTREGIQADAFKLARYTTVSLVSAARNHPNARLRVVDHPGPDTLVVETAITELVPAKTFWNASATAAGFVVPGAGLLGAAGKGSIAIEGRLRDGGTGAVLAAFRERETDQMAIVSVASYTWYQGSKANIDEFAKKASEILNAPAGKTVNRSFPIKLVAF